MITNFEITKDEKITEKTTSKNCECVVCKHDIIPFEDTQLIVDFLGWKPNENGLYDTPINHCCQESKIVDMQFHNSLDWLTIPLLKASNIENDTAQFMCEWNFESMLFDVRESHNQLLLWIAKYNKDVADTYELATDFFYVLIEKSGTYYLSDYVEEYAEELSEEDGMKVITERNNIREECKRLKIDFHHISCNVGREFLDREEAKEELGGALAKTQIDNDVYQSFSLVESDIDLLKQGLESLQEVKGKLIEEMEKVDKPNDAHYNGTCDALRHDHFDCYGLIGMLKESAFVSIGIPKDKLDNWSASNHNVDFPSPYCEQL